MSITKTKMPETMYRASRCCRILGNPTAYLILRALGKRRITPTEISRNSELNLSTVSRTLRHLRDIDMVRYETLT
jgi:DNA-binding transcriptional ArsR family regulator